MLFTELGLIDPILTALTAEGYETPTPIQQEAIPYLLQGRDLLGVAQTGTGKTAAFALPILQQLTDLTRQEMRNPKIVRPIRALILTPTRELAIQIDESIATYGTNLRIKHTVIFGGVGQTGQVNTLRAGVDILVATPGRLLDLIGQGYVSLRAVTHFVLDEADRMLDMGFINDVKKVIARLPAARQTLFFSATMPPEVSKLAETILTKPVRVEVTPASSTVEKIEQRVYFVEQDNKKKLLAELLEDRSIKSALVFARTKHGSDKIVKDLQKLDISAEAIHGNKSQNARQRALSNFKSGETRVLVATDIAARGIDVDNLAFVVNYELPNIPETYVHRIGRTGRAGKDGLAVSFCEEEEKEFLRDIQKLIGKKLPVVADHPYPLVGGRTVENAAPSSIGKNQGRQGRPGGGGSGRPAQGRAGDGRAGSDRPSGQSAGRTGSSSRPSSGGRGGSSGESRR
jgi:ATP-dependent RNA helicase RhlE